MKIQNVKLIINITNPVQCLYDLNGCLSIHNINLQRFSFTGKIQVEHFSRRTSLINTSLHFDCLAKDYPSYIEKIKMICKDNKDAIMHKDDRNSIEASLSQLAQIKYMDFPDEEIIIEVLTNTSSGSGFIGSMPF
jgi:hypothetical protein